MVRKTRILFNSEIHINATGYSKLAKEMLTRLAATGKYELAELASYYCEHNHEQRHQVSLAPWKVYATAPNPLDQEAVQSYNSHPENKHGRFVFNDVCLDFQPDIHFTYKDYWYDNYCTYFPFRNFYHNIWWNPIDGYPQDLEWIARASESDGCFTYTDWGAKILSRACRYNSKLLGCMPLGVDYNIFNPLYNKAQIKQLFGFKPEALIIGYVCRNQPRKLIPSLMESFVKFLRKAPKEVSNRAFLYFHTAWPDISWNIPQLLKDYGIGNKTLFTYQCANCQAIYPTVYCDIGAVCMKCNTPSTGNPRTSKGVTDKDLNFLYNFMDIYCQVHNCLSGNSEIYTNDGWKEIKNIKINDKVFTHTGVFQKVTNTFVNPTDNIYKIQLHGDFEELEVTGEHPLLAITNKKNKQNAISLREYLGCRLHYNKPLPNPDFINVKELENGNMIAYYIDDNIVDIDKFDLSFLCFNEEIVNNEEVILNNGSGDTYKRFVNIDVNFCKFLGLFAADGYAGTNSIHIDCHENELENVKFAENIFNSFGYNKKSVTKKYKNRKAYKISYHSAIYAKLMYQFCNKKENKCLPDFVELLPLDKQLAVVQGLFLGDGCYQPKIDTSIYSTISLKLARQLKTLLRRLRINYNVRLLKRKGNRKDTYRFEVSGDVVNNIRSQKRKNTRNLYYEHYHLLQIKNIENYEYSESVYNIEVEHDNSYLTRVGIAHNCEGFGIPTVEAMACGIPSFATDYAGTIDMIQKAGTIPIKSLGFVREVESATNRFIAIPDTDYLANQLVEILSIPDCYRRQIGHNQHLKVKEHFCWDKAVKIFMENIDRLPQKDWSKPPFRLTKPDMNMPKEMSPELFVWWGYNKIMCRPELYQSYKAMRTVYELIMGVEGQKPHFNKTDKDRVLRNFIEDANFYNFWEQKRMEKFNGKQ